jgi:mannitol-1-phosphate 5-dehydrogenase
MAGSLTFVGFGFGPIQAGLFVLEAFLSGHFRRLVVAEVLPDVVRSIREAGGRFWLNVAHPDRVESLPVGPVEVYDPAVPEDRQRLVAAVAEASEVATAVPSVRFYRTSSPGSIHSVLAQGLAERDGKPAVVYAAENHNQAAEILEEAVLSEIPRRRLDRVRGGTRFVNTVIGKMSGIVAEAERLRSSGLRTLTSRDPRAFLVEEFRRILISRIRLPEGTSFLRGLDIFEEKDDLLPFEEAKLYGHNAVHSLAAYLAAHLKMAEMQELRGKAGALEFLRAAFLEESGEALLGKWKGKDRLFTPDGFKAYVDDLISRMFNPFLGDLVERVARDPERKLGWDDRLVGTLRLALARGIPPWRFALGTAAALACLVPEALREDESAAGRLEGLWESASPAPDEKDRVLRWTRRGLDELRVRLSRPEHFFAPSPLTLQGTPEV